MDRPMAKVTVEEFKADLRRLSLAKRDAIPPEVRQAAAETIAGRPFPYQIKPGMVVSGYAPMQSELNPGPLLRKLSEAGATLALPVVAARGKPLIMRQWAFGEPLAKGNWGIREPMPDAAEAWPDILLVPLAAFDRKGNRIGYGAGYYDLTINRLRVLKSVVAIGLAYQSQHVAVVPFTPRDARLDLVLTERELIDCGRK
jgi:5-formyltetrahydrofolate cyclo-ligase